MFRIIKFITNIGLERSIKICFKLFFGRLSILPFEYFYKPVILVIILYKTARNNKKNIGNKIRNFLILTKFLKGVKITRIKPIKVLIKKRG